MTSALAAALRELQHSRNVLERELDGHPAFADWQRLEGAADAPGSAELRRELRTSLEQLAVFRAWQSVVASLDMLTAEAGAAVARPLSSDHTSRDAIATQWRRPPPVAAGRTDAFASPRRFSPPPGPPQALTAIRGITPALAQRLEAMGIQRYAQIAAWTADDVRHVRAALGLGKDISRRNWIEQAALLDATGGRRGRRGDREISAAAAREPVAPAAPSRPHQRMNASDVPAAAVKPEREPEPFRTSAPASPAGPVPTAPIDAESMRAAARAAAAIAVRALAPLVTPRDEPLPEGEAEKEARAIEETPAALASSPDAVTWMPTAGLIAFGDVRPARRPLPRPDAGRYIAVPELPKLLRRPKPVPEPAASAPLQPEERAPDGPSMADDLRRIAGIGPLSADKLAQAGITDYAMIAAWRRADIERAARTLGIDWRRICREGWIEQAAFLAAGHRTAFAERYARGDVDALCTPPPPPPLRQPTQPAISPAPSGIAGATSREAETISADQAPTVPPAVSLRRITVDPPQVELPAIAPDPGADLPDIEPAEAMVTVVRVAPPATPASSSPSSAVTSRVAEAFRVEPRREARTSDIPDIEVSLDHWSAPAAIEEAAVEIVRKNGEVTASYGPAPSSPSPLTPSANRLASDRRPDAQPVWITEREAEAGSVVRRFLKALKRDG